MVKYMQTESPVGLSLGGLSLPRWRVRLGIWLHIVGKPLRTFLLTVMNDFYATGELSKSGEGKIAVIGDDVEADLGVGVVN